MPAIRPKRLRMLPKLFRDFVPSALPRQLEFKQAASMLPPPPSPSPEPVPEECEPSEPPYVPPPKDFIETDEDAFGFIRRYHYKPARHLDAEESPDDFVNSSDISPAPSNSARPTLLYATPLHGLQLVDATLQSLVDWFAPFLNPTVFRLVHWAYTGSTSKSHGEISRLVQNVLLAPDFDQEHLRGFSISCEERRLDKAILSVESLTSLGWLNETAYIPMPKERVKYACMEDVPKLAVKNCLRRAFTPIITSICKDPVMARHRNFNGFELWHVDPITGTRERVHGEVFTSDAFLREETRIRALPPNPADGPNVEPSLFPLLEYCDGAHLANFGTASLHPLYTYDLGLSKEIRGKRTNFAAHHTAYMPSVSLLSSAHLV